MSDNATTIKSTSTYNMRNALVNYYLLLMFTFFELFLTSQYTKARTDKYILFIVLTTLLFVSIVAVSISYHLDKKAPNKVVEQKRFLSLSITDIGFIIFFVGAVISTLISSHTLDSLTGNAGRNNGLILLTLYFVMYFIVSRFYYYKEYVLSAFLVFGSIISLLAILHFFYIDPLGIMVGYGDNIVNDFGSTIGNKNTIAAYMCIFLPVAIMMFVIQKSKTIKMLSAVATAFAYCGLLVAGSNSGYIGFFAMLFFLVLVCIRKADRLKNLFFCLAIMFSSGLVLRLFSLIMNDKSKGFESIGEKLVYSSLTFVLIFACLMLAVLLHLSKDSKFATQNWPKNTFTIIVVFIFLLIVSVFAYYFYYYTVVDTKSDIGALSQILRFDDRWGTHRGFMWINGVKDYLNFDFMHILFGSGCDTFYHVFEPHFEELLTRFNNSSTDCIHSEYLNYLVTQGIVGLSSYLLIITSTVIRALNTSKNNPLVLIFMMPVITYFAQSVVNLYTPVVTPFLFIFIALCECLSRDSNSVNKLNLN